MVYRYKASFILLEYLFPLWESFDQIQKVTRSFYVKKNCKGESIHC